MKNRNWTQLAGSMLLAALLLGSMSVHTAMPAGEYACQVAAEGGRIGLVLVQADTRERAAEAAVGAQAMTFDRIPSRAVRVVQCIDRRSGERFSDIQFQAFFENVPL